MQSHYVCISRAVGNQQLNVCFGIFVSMQFFYFSQFYVRQILSPVGQYNVKKINMKNYQPTQYIKLIYSEKATKYMNFTSPNLKFCFIKISHRRIIYDFFDTMLCTWSQNCKLLNAVHWWRYLCKGVKLQDFISFIFSHHSII